jgi:Domain of unknown function (DUF4249)
MRKQYLIVLLAVATLLTWGCKTDFEVYAPEKEIRSVYCVLNLEDTVQYVRVAKAFQYKGDAIAYAATTDVSVSGLQVKLKGNGKTWTGVEVPNFPKDAGAFLPTHTVYKFITSGVGIGHDTLVPNKEYTLEVSKPDAADFVTAKTILPEAPRIRGELQTLAGAGNSLCLPKLFLDRKLNLIWKKASSAGVKYEIRVGLNFQANNVAKSLQWGPTSLISENSGCNEGSGSVCRQFQEKELLRDFVISMPDEPLILYTYETTDSCVPLPSLAANLPKSLWFEVTAVDEFLGNYMTVNDPAVTDINGVKPEYTNLTGNIEAVGVFGSYSLDRKYAIMRECSEALLKLNGRPLPVGCEW